MQNLASQSSEPRISPWKILYRPMLAASLALHGLALMLPIPATPEPVAEAESTEEETIDLAALDALVVNPSPSPLPSAASTPEAIAPTPFLPPIPTAAAVAPAPVPATVPPPEPTPSLTPAATPTPTASATPQPTPTPTQAAAPIPAAFQNLTPEQLQQLRDFLAQREAAEASAAGAIGQTARAAQQTAINCSLFENYAQLFFTDCGSSGVEPQRKPAIFAVEVVPVQRRNRVLQYYQETFPNYTFEPIATPYADGEVYAMMLNSSPVFYLNVVSVGLRGSTKIAVLWSSNPTEPTS